MTDRIDDPELAEQADTELLDSHSSPDSSPDASPDASPDDAVERAPDTETSISMFTETSRGTSTDVGAVVARHDLATPVTAFDERRGEAVGVPLATRLWRRVVRRPVEWANRPWPNERIIRYVVTVLSLGITTGIMLNLVHLNLPWTDRDLVFDDTTPTGGDFGAHVWGPAYLRDHLLGSFRLNGWTMDWYGGMPAYRFYMVLPALGILALDVVLPYGVAMKVVSVLGLITLPAACWAFGRLADFRYPMPELFAFAGLAFALDESFSIYGGNLLSTMAGEFSFSIALSLSMLALGLFANGLRTGKYRVWASVLIAAACVSHGIVLIFTVGALIVFALVWIDRTRTRLHGDGRHHELVVDHVVGRSVPVESRVHDRHEVRRADRLVGDVLSTDATARLHHQRAGVFGFVIVIVRRHLNAAALGVVGLVFAAGVYLAKDSLPFIGLLWNPRTAAVPVSGAVPHDDGRRCRVVHARLERRPRSAGPRSCDGLGRLDVRRRVGRRRAGRGRIHVPEAAMRRRRRAAGRRRVPLLVGSVHGDGHQGDRARVTAGRPTISAGTRAATSTTPSTTRS